jgi:enediyne polyketide synthase
MDIPSPSVDLDAFPRLVLDPQEELYGGLFFQAGRFQRVGGYRQVAAHSALAELTHENGVAWFSRFLPPDLVLGDPGARDALMHAIQVCAPLGTLLPVGVERIVPGVAQAEGPCYVWARERMGNGNGNGGTLVYDVVLTDGEGHPREQWQGLKLKLMGGTAFDGPWSAPVLGAYMERRLEELLPAGALTVAIERDPDGDRRARSNRTIQRALGEAVAVQRRPDGKPEASNGRVVSAAHAADLTLAVAGANEEGPIGCDVEPVTARPAELWGDLLGAERFKLADAIAQAADEDQDRAATRVWAASECLTKAGAAVNAPLTLAATKTDGWVLISAGALTVATLVTQVQTSPEPLALAVLRRNDNGIGL